VPEELVKVGVVVCGVWRLRWWVLQKDVYFYFFKFVLVQGDRQQQE
jgi:hypothetical protein